MGFVNKLKALFSRPAVKEIKTVEMLHLRINTMRSSVEYEIKGGPRPVLSLYRLGYGDREAAALEKSVTCDQATPADLLNACGVCRWDGFHGKHPRHVSDGTAFRFHATVNGGVDIRADGSQNFPKGYRELVRALDDLLAKAE